MAEEEPIPCRGSEDRMCLCDMCLYHKLTLLQQAQPSVQQQILQHLPALQSASTPHVANPPPPPRSPPPPPRQTSAPPRQNSAHHQANPNLHQIFSSSSPPPPRSPPHSPPHHSSATPQVPSSSQSQHPSTGPASLADLLNSSPPLHLGNQSLFSIPLFPTNMDADIDTVPAHPNREAFEPEDIVIPPLVRERIPNILTYIKYTLDSTKITSDVKKAAMVESIEEVLAICDKIFRKGDNPMTMP
ncbi:hypothetical protein L7F22_001128 [Adiantum nelumboides]|nr:hypothetical protein [Adiantum nelumboides]